MRRLISNPRGMTLAEVLVALPIITIGLLALLSAIPLSTYATQEGSQTSTATFLDCRRGTCLGSPHLRLRLRRMGWSPRLPTRTRWPRLTRPTLARFA